MPRVNWKQVVVVVVVEWNNMFVFFHNTTMIFDDAFYHQLSYDNGFSIGQLVRRVP